MAQWYKLQFLDSHRPIKVKDYKYQFKWTIDGWMKSAVVWIVQEKDKRMAGTVAMDPTLASGAGRLQGA